MTTVVQDSSGQTAFGERRQPSADVSHELAYHDAHEHLLELLARYDCLLRRELMSTRPRSVTDVMSFAAITAEEVDSLLTGTVRQAGAHEDALAHRTIGEAIDRYTRRIERRVQFTLAAGRNLPMVDLAQRFMLSPLEIEIVVACMAVEIDRRYERIYGYLQDDMGRKQPTPGLVLSLFCESPARRLAARQALNPLAPLRYFRIVEVIDDGAPVPRLANPLAIDERIVAFLLGDSAVDARIASLVTRIDTELADTVLNQRQQADVTSLVEHGLRWLRGRPTEQKPMLYLHGTANGDSDALVRAAAHRLGLPVLAIDLDLFTAPGTDFDQTMFLLCREGLLSQAAIHLQNLDRALDMDPGGQRYRSLVRLIAEMSGLVFLSGQCPWHWPVPPASLVLRPLELRSGGFREQIEVWRTIVGGAMSDDDLHRVISCHPLPAGGIHAAWRLAQSLADEGGAGQQVEIKHLEEACRAHARAPVSGLARRIEPKHCWEDIVLPTVQFEQLRAICSQAKHVSAVYGAWGFERKLSLGKGLNALFSGPPGTGKTLAAEVIAADLKVEILKIDLSQIVSKYIGETEKNLRQLFDQASVARAILFFDEADALLGKRSEVKDAHDRYANTEVAYLLQKMEEYEGITILASNLRQNMDEAFIRRMRFIVEFPFPEEDDRLRIWESIWPKEVPLAKDIDLQRLAREFRLSGGSIRNIALVAAFLAAEHNQPVGMGHLMHATKSELQKIGRLINDNEFPKHG